MTRYRHASVGGIKVFYREDSPANVAAILLLHGFPTSSHMFRNLTPALADNYQVMAPTFPVSASQTLRVARTTS
jgi:pimeloyl-ACP methyl ester carboxylesterase